MNNLSWDQLQLLVPAKAAEPPYRPLTGLAPVIMVGLTGVGKTTVLNLLAERDVRFTLLPNRRELTDRVIIASLQQAEGQAPHPITDRLARFDYTARYRAKFPGGMAHALSQLALNPAQAQPHLFFDGLRGLEEVQQATVYFPHARFVVLDAPDTSRLQRLLKRDDAFDTAVAQISPTGQSLLSILKETPNIETVFTLEQLQQLASAAATAQLPIEEVLQKVSIIVKERHNYDSVAARDFLSRQLPLSQLLTVDTAAHPAEAVAGQIAGWLDNQDKA
ncbi:MAG: AAA family ATPase [Chloroflexota bacterium]